jgi:putative transposase
VWQRGNNRRTIFTDSEDRTLFLDLLQNTARKRSWQCLSYCLLGNHFHLVVETAEPTLGVGMRDIGSRYAQLFNERHATGGGHVFQGRFGSKVATSDERLAQLLRYVALNPVRAGLCSDPAAWPWSSHAALLASAPHPLVSPIRVAALLEPFGGDPATRYRRLFDLDGPLRHIPPDLSPWELRPMLQEIFRSDDVPTAVRRARRHGYRVAEIARYTGLSEATVSRRMRSERDKRGGDERRGPVPQ